ncbi:MAG: HAMP domain-containing sensor histidine kinase [Oscillospiraceae bacterium]
MEFSIRVKSITTRWLVNVLSVVTAIVVIVEIMLCLLVNNYYMNGVEEAANSFSQSFSVLSLSKKEEFSETAKTYAENFEYKDKIEIQVFDSAGNFLVTTSGFNPKIGGNMPDYTAAAKASSGYAMWHGKNDDGEMIAAATTTLPNFGKGSNGSYRWVASIDAINRKIIVAIVAAIIVGFLIMMLSIFSGLYFIKSIVKPVREVSNTARKIALGDLNARLEVRENNEIGELCDTINYMASELGRAEIMKNDFISSVSHELRTPLTAIRGWGETVKMSIGNDNEIVERGVDVILSEANRLSGLVEELLDFSRMQSGKLSMDMKQVNIIEVMREAVYMYVELAKKNNIELTFIEPKKDVMVMADQDRIKQVFINIIDNAIKYSTSGGHVFVSSEKEEGCIRLIVSDTGVGIASQDLEHVKEKFYKANKTVRGSGIGLAVADEIIKQHNGLVFLESTENVGTTVTIVLPTEISEISEPAPVYFPPTTEENKDNQPVPTESLDEIITNTNTNAAQNDN